MISEEQMAQCESEFAKAAATSFGDARMAEQHLESMMYPRGGQPYDRNSEENAAKVYTEADYMAESRAWILQLIRKARATKPNITGEHHE